MTRPVSEDDAGRWRLVEADGRLELRTTEDGPGPVFVDFVDGPLGYSRRVPGSRLLFQAVGIKGGYLPTIIDATAGLGRDAFVLACRGCTVTAIERSPTIAALLEDGMKRAMADPSVRQALGGRLRFITADARDYLRAMPEPDRFDVVYLDPMFPARQKSAMVKKESMALRGVVGADGDAVDLLEAARKAARRRVVVKRMLHAPPIGPGATHSHRGKSTRFDVYAGS